MLLKNSAWLISAQAITKIISFFYTIFLAKALGASDFGHYIVALSYFAIVSSIADFGITRFLTREISENKFKAAKLISSSIISRLCILVIFSLLFMIGIFILDPDITRRELSLIAFLAALPQCVSLTLDTTLVAFLRIKYSALGLIILNLFTVFIGVTLVYENFGSYGAASALIIGQFLYIIALLIILSYQKINWFGLVRFEAVREIIKGSLPYGVLGFIGLVSFRMDALILSYFKGGFETGLYGAAYKFLDAAVLIPGTFAIAFFPIIARLHNSDVLQLKKVYFQSIKVLLPMSLVIVLAFIFVLPIIIQIFLPNYLASIQILQILSLAVPFIFLHIPSGQVILSTDKFLNQMILIYIALLFLNLIMYLLFIPRFGMIGAAGVTVLSEILTALVFLLFLRSKVFKG